MTDAGNRLLEGMEDRLFTPTHPAATSHLPCGHPDACVVSSDEGTHYCRWCEEVGALEAQIEELRRLCAECEFTDTDD